MERLTNDELKTFLKNLKTGNVAPFINMTDENVEMFISMITEILEHRNNE